MNLYRASEIIAHACQVPVNFLSHTKFHSPLIYIPLNPLLRLRSPTLRTGQAGQALTRGTFFVSSIKGRQQRGVIDTYSFANNLAAVYKNVDGFARLARILAGEEPANLFSGSMYSFNQQKHGVSDR